MFCQAQHGIIRLLKLHIALFTVNSIRVFQKHRIVNKDVCTFVLFDEISTLLHFYRELFQRSDSSVLAKFAQKELWHCSVLFDQTTIPQFFNVAIPWTAILECCCVLYRAYAYLSSYSAAYANYA